MVDQSLEHRVAAVTGASGRLGRMTVDAFLERGATVIALGRSGAARAASGERPRVEAVHCDVLDPESVRDAFEHVALQHGRLDALVHTVGAWGMTPLLESDADDWDRLVRVNLHSTYLCFREAARVMAAGEGGGLVAITAAQGADRGVGGQSAYSVAKAGVVRLVEAVADELADRNVTARAVAPSTILYGNETGSGVPAEAIVRLCVDCASPRAPFPSGAVVRAYGSV